MGPIDTQAALSALPAGDETVAPAAGPAYAARATRAALQFEGFFIAHMLHQMRAGAHAMAGEDSMFKDPASNDLLDMADNMLADKMAGQRAFGIADAILRQLLPQQAGLAAPPGLPLPGAAQDAALNGGA